MLPNKDAGWQTTQDVKNIEIIRLQNTVAKNLNAFKNGSEGNTVRLLGDGFTTVVNNAAGLTGPDEPLITNTGANKLLAAQKVYRFTRYLNVGSTTRGTWYEDA